KVNFPDSMSETEIQSAIEKDIVPKTPTEDEHAVMAGRMLEAVHRVRSAREADRADLDRIIKEAFVKPFVQLPRPKPIDPTSTLDQTFAAVADKLEGFVESLENPVGAALTATG